MNQDRKIRIAIDGPGGAGKSSVAKEIAKRRGMRYVDTGALYRSVGLYVADHGIAEDDTEGIVSCLPHIRIELTNDGGVQKIIMNGEDVGDRIRTPRASVYSSAVSKIPAVRDALLGIQRDLAAQGGVVMDGRDIGTVIIPDAEVKIFLTASRKRGRDGASGSFRKRASNSPTRTCSGTSSPGTRTTATGRRRLCAPPTTP